jgi:hypothetical protein
MLPIGTIVYLKEGTSKIMILNRCPIIKSNDENVLFDYSGAIYPLGLDNKKTLYFNKENIDQVVFKGYTDEEDERYIKLVNDMLINKKDEFKKGTVSKSYT